MVHRDMTNNNTDCIMVHRDMILAIIPILSWYIEI